MLASLEFLWYVYLSRKMLEIALIGCKDIIGRKRK